MERQRVRLHVFPVNTPHAYSHAASADRKPVPSIDALRAHGIAPITFGPKEALAVVNGTGPSCAVGALALHDASLLLLASQALTALAIEALCGTPETFDPFLHDTARPHPGQIEVSRNCRVLLAGSSLARWHDETNPEHTLRQDRYGLRTAPQWIGPQVEELMTSWRAIEIEMNSTTDNPIIDLEGQRSVHGGNFQVRACVRGVSLECIDPVWRRARRWRSLWKRHEWVCSTLVCTLCSCVVPAAHMIQASLPTRSS